MSAALWAPFCYAVGDAFENSAPPTNVGEVQRQVGGDSCIGLTVMMMMMMMVNMRLRRLRRRRRDSAATIGLYRRRQTDSAVYNSPGPVLRGRTPARLLAVRPRSAGHLSNRALNARHSPTARCRRRRRRLDAAVVDRRRFVLGECPAARPRRR